MSKNIKKNIPDNISENIPENNTPSFHIPAHIPVLKLKPQRAKPFWQGESLVFSGALDPKNKDLSEVQLVLVADSDGKTLIGSGMYNPASSYRVRLLDHGKTPSTDLLEILKKRIQESLDFRKTLGLIPNQKNNPESHPEFSKNFTNAFRLINSEGDNLSGLTIDCYADQLVLSVTAAWVLKFKEQVQQALLDLIPGLTLAQIHWRLNKSALKQEGALDLISDSNPEFNPTASAASASTASNISNPENILVQENGLNFLVDITRGQKTGFYCDQRNNRENIRHLFKNQKSDQTPHKKYRVLDTFCYTGGFAMNAALGGADYILGIDSSEAALGLAQENAQKNNLGEKIKFEKHDVEYFLTHLAANTLNPPEQPFDLIILDPPKLAPSKEKIYQAKKLYLRLNRLALKALNPQGVLISCSCSDAFSKEDLIETIELAARQAGREISIKTIQGASPDHKIPKGARYGDYLKVVTVELLN